MSLKIGLKLWNINAANYLEKAVRLYQEGIYDFIELYVVPGHLDLLEQWQQVPVPFNIHAPHFQHGMNLSKAESFAGNIDKYQEVKRYADELAADYIIFHGGTDGDYRETARQLQAIQDPRTVIENKPYKTLPFIQGYFYVGGKNEEIRYIIEQTGCRFCLDIGHASSAANALGFEPYAYIQDFMALKPFMFHLSDIDTTSEMDAHLNYGQGNLDFQRLAAIIGEHPTIAIETNKNQPDQLDDFRADAAFLRRYFPS